MGQIDDPRMLSLSCPTANGGGEVTRYFLAVACALFLSALSINAADRSETHYLDLKPGEVPSVRKSVLLVFVHGVNGSDLTWVNSKGAYWPSIVQSDKDVFGNADILIYEYPSPYLWESYAIGDLAKRLNSDLDDPSVGAKNYSQIVFIAHSMGGLVVRQMLLDADADMQRRVEAIMLFGSPMGGSIKANWVNFFSKNAQYQGLKKGADPDSVTNRLVDSWINKRMAVDSYCAYGLSDAVVELASALPLCNSALRPLPLGHLALVKPESRLSDQHLLLRSWWLDVFDGKANSSITEETSRIVVASCSGDKNYTENDSSRIAQALNGVAGELARRTALLPPDWSSDWIKTQFWRVAAPKVIVIHLSCFERDFRGAGSIADRNHDFGLFLRAFKDDAVPILVYSRAFKKYPTFMAEQLNKLGLTDVYRDRLVTHVVEEGKLPGEDTGATGDLVKAVDQLLK